MKISSFKRLIKEDVDKQFQPLIDKIGFSINPFAEEVVKVLTNNVNIADNGVEQIKTISVQVDSSGTPTTPLQFKTGLPTLCAGHSVIKADNTTNPKIYPTGYPFLSFTEANFIITVNNITGLPANNKFDLKIILYPT